MTTENTMTEKPERALIVGDTMRWSLELLEYVKVRGDQTALVRVKDIVRASNGEVMVWLEHVESSDSGVNMRLSTGEIEH
jgi:hypothetical protein